MRKWTACTLVALTLLLTGCAKKNSVSVTMTDFRFSPESWTVEAGQTITVTAANKGTLVHRWVVLKKDAAITPPFTEDDKDKVYFEIEAEPHASKTATFTAPSEPGDYEVVCNILGHMEAGMTGTLTVK